MTERDSDPELNEPELKEFERLDAAEEARLSALLKHAFAPTAIDATRHERVLLAALEDPFAEPSPEELVESERLRRALEGAGDHADLALARALANAYAPSAAAPQVDTPAARSASLASASSAVSAPAKRASAKVFYLRFGSIAAVVAAAASVLLAIQARSNQAPTPDLPALALAQSRSTAALFQTASREPPSARIDRIASLRERDLRNNRYAMWGVR
ncbi:MAG: hypothetical protein ABI488_04550 [Polyangiaceae bacterium]